MYSIMSSVSSDSFTSFLICIHFVSFSFLIAVDRTPELCWITVVKVDTLVLFLILGGMLFNFFTIEHNVCCNLIIYGLYYVEVDSLYAHFLKSVHHKWVLNFVKGFSPSIETIIWFLCLNLLIWYIKLTDWRILKNPYIPGINPTWSWCMSFSMCCWILFAKILLRIFASMFFSDIGL